MRNKIILSLFILLINYDFSNAEDTLELIHAKKQKQVSFKIEGLGGHSDYCAQITLTNSTNQALNIVIRPGTLMVPKDSTLQDLLVVEKKELKLNPGQKIVSKLRAFCAAHYKHSPTEKSVFKATIGDSNLIKLANYIDKHPNIADIQSAVWVVANGIPISSIDKENMELVKIVSKLSKQPIPDYTVIFANSSDALFSGQASRIKGEIEYTVIGEDMVSLQIYDDKGRLRKTVFNGRLARRGKHVEEYDIDISKLKKGVYFIKVHQQNQLISEKRFEI